MTDRELLLQAEENIMDAVCALCRWPDFYDDEETMYTERCDKCPAAQAVTEELEKLK